MNNFFRAIIAGYGAKKLGGGCFGTIIVFIILWVALGQCSLNSRKVPPPETYPASRRAATSVYPPASIASLLVETKAPAFPTPAPLKTAAQQYLVPEMKGAQDAQYLQLLNALATPWEERLYA